MADEKSHAEQGQLERARRLREQIQHLRSGATGVEQSHEKSLREQIEERVEEQEKQRKRE